MGKKQKRAKEAAATASAATANSAKATGKGMATGRAWYRNWQQLAILVGILVATFVVYSPALDSAKEFVSLDDPTYITEQPIIQGLDSKHLDMIFSQPVSLNYHPITMLSLAWNYDQGKLQPYGYFFTNIAIHVFNTLLVFVFLYLLSGRKFWVGAIAALLFGIHPMHVESVAWASERKDVLYCFFFLQACIAYYYYNTTSRWWYLLGCLVLYVLACLSKAMAAPLPLVLLLMDYYMGQRLTVKKWVEKVPFVALMLAVGLYAVKIQSQGALAAPGVYNMVQRIMLSSYGFVMYWVKLFLPVGLSAIYPYPGLTASGSLPLVYLLSPLFALLIVLVPFAWAYRYSKADLPLLVFGYGFFFAMFAMVSQFIAVGIAIMADRYSYLPYIGATFIIATLLNRLIERTATRTLALGGVGVVSLVFAVACYGRVDLWRNGDTLFSDAIEKYPYVIERTGNVMTVKQIGAYLAYISRGKYYIDHKMMDKARKDYQTLVDAQAPADDAYTGLANFYAIDGKFEEALKLYNKAISMKPGNSRGYFNRGNMYSNMGKHKEAIPDFEKAYQLESTLTQLPQNIAREKLQAGMFAEAIVDCDKLLAKEPNNTNLLFTRGTANVNLGNLNEAIADLSKATQLQPAMGDAWYNLSVAYVKTNNKPQALVAATNAKQAGFAVSDQYLQSLQGK